MTLHYDESAPLASAPPASGSGIRRDAVDFESWGWSSRPDECGPKLAALASLANLESPDPIASVSYTSHGNLLVVAGPEPDTAHLATESLADRLHLPFVRAGEQSAHGRS